MEDPRDPFATHKKSNTLSEPTSRVRRDVFDSISSSSLPPVDSDVLISSFIETTTFLTTSIESSTNPIFLSGSFTAVTFGSSAVNFRTRTFITTQTRTVVTTITPTPTITTPTNVTPTSDRSPLTTRLTLVTALSVSIVGLIVTILVGLCVIWYLRRKRSRRTEATSTASPDGSKFSKLFGGEGRWGHGLSRGKTAAPISTPSEDTLSYEHDVEQSGPMIWRVSLDVEDSGQTDSEKPEENMSTRASYGGPHPDPPDPPPVPSLSPSVFGRSAAMTSEVSVSGPPISARRPRQEEDGGVHIAGERSGADAQSVGDTGSLHTLPPAYDDYL